MRNFGSNIRRHRVSPEYPNSAVFAPEEYWHSYFRNWPIASFVVVQHVQQIKHFGRRAIEARNHAGVGQRIQELVAGLYRTPPELTKRLVDMLRRA